jgi:hypothetical protein
VPETPPVTPPATIPPAQTPEISTQNGAAIAQGIGAVAASIASIVSTVETAKLAALANPCVRLAVLEDRLQVSLAGLDKMKTAAQFFASASQSAVLDSIDNWGTAHGGISRTGGKPFAAWIWEAGVITGPEAVPCYLLPWVFCLAAIQSGMPASGTEAPSSSNTGYRVGPGLYRYPNATGTWRGSTFRSEWVSWRRYQRNNVWSPASGRPNWKARLTAWCGRYRSTWEVWRPDDPIDENSTIGRAIVSVTNFAGVVEEARARCAEGVELTTQLALDENTRLNQMVLDGGVLSLETLASEERQVSTVALAGVMGVALVMLWNKK